MEGRSVKRYWVFRVPMEHVNNPSAPLAFPVEEEVKNFCITHNFQDPSVSSSSNVRRFYGLDWKINFTKNTDGSVIGLECINNRFRWTVAAKVMIKIYTFRDRMPKWVSMHTSATFNSLCSIHTVKTFSNKELKLYLNKIGALRVEIHVKIDRIELGSDIARRFDDDRSKQFSDVALVVNGQKFYVCKMYLASHSPVFNALFFGNFSESEKSEIQLKDIDPMDFQNFLELIHGESSIFESTLEGILNLADMYQCATALRRCEHFLMEQSKLSLQEKIDIANAFGLEEAKKKFKT